MPKICNIGITRLFSTGRYEHTKISVNMEPGEKPGTMLQELQGLIEDLNPTCPVDDFDFRVAQKTLEEPEDEENPFAQSHENARKVIDRYNDWIAKRHAAYARLDELGATAAIESIDNTPTGD